VIGALAAMQVPNRGKNPASARFALKLCPVWGANENFDKKSIKVEKKQKVTSVIFCYLKPNPEVKAKNDIDNQIITNLYKKALRNRSVACIFATD
jgi:hypothetical protein